ncbi:MAG: hypothetical protein LQ346_001491 [Caloplaca aetnensis]|nr:MAG: hypothetical protein LQ346_001491 [Caloplaca aetnensis]
MSSITGFLKGGRAKSEKGQTPPRVVYGDLGSAYASIAQRGSPSTPDLRRAASGGVTSPAETNATLSPIQSPQSGISPAAPLLQRTDTIRASHLSRDLFIQNDFDAEVAQPGELVDPFTTTTDRESINTLTFKKRVLDTHFGVTADDVSGNIEDAAADRDHHIKSVLSANEYPELQKEQLEACAQLSGADHIVIEESQPLDRSATIQSIPTRHDYGQLSTNADIHSFRGSHVEVPSSGDEQTIDVQWSPRPSSELQTLKKIAPHSDNPARIPPPTALPRTPQRTGFFLNKSVNDRFSTVEQASSSSRSYGDTGRLLDLSSPRITGNAPQDPDFFQGLKRFAKEGSSSRGNSSKSFATFSIKEADGNILTRPISQGEFQQLDSAITSRLRHTSQVATDNGLLHVGEISIDFPEASEVDAGPGSSQTASSSEHQINMDLGTVQPPLRTRRGTPLLFRAPTEAHKETDWETVRESHKTTSSVADYSDSASDRPPKSLLSTEPGNLLERPIHPRYNHSWDLKQDVRNGGYVLTPIHEVRGGVSFPNEHAVNYSHPIPLATIHDHPFASSPPPIRLSRSSTWMSTAAGEIPVAGNIPPIPSRNPYRRQRQVVPVEEIELQPFSSHRIPQVDPEHPTPSTSRTQLINPFDDPVPGSPIRPASVVVADMISPPRMNARADRRGQREWVPVPHPVYGSASRGNDVPHLTRRDLEPGPPMTYEQRVARHFLAVCALLPVLLPLYAMGYLDFLMRIYTGGQITEFPRWEKRACWGLLAAWAFVALCVIPFVTIANIH